MHKAVYGGTETRFNLCTLGEVFGDSPAAIRKTNRIKDLANSVGCLVLEGRFEVRNEGSMDPWVVNRNFFNEKDGSPTLERKVAKKIGRKKIPIEISFSNEPPLGIGTAFLIGEDLVLTAAHCIFNSDNPNKRKDPCPTVLVFGFEVQPEQKDNPYEQLVFEHTNVYRIKNVVAHQLIDNPPEGKDWAILQLDRKVEGRDPLTVSCAADFKVAKRICMLGHPWGIPIKYTEGTIEKINSIHGGNYFESMISAFEGNSGSPAFYNDGKSNTVIGMLCRGNKDYGVVNGVLKEKKVTERKIKKRGYEHLLKVTTLPFLRATLSSINRQFLNQDAEYQTGLSLEGECRNLGCKEYNKLVVHHVPDQKGVIDIAKACCEAFCSCCEQKLDYDDVNTMVLSNCTYQIDARNTNGESVVGTFHLLPIDEFPKALKFDVQEWYHIELKISPLPDD